MRGKRTAPETRNPFLDSRAAPYGTPAQLAASLITGWLLVFEDPESETLWLGKGIPSAGLAEGKKLAVSDAPTRLGLVRYALESGLNSGVLSAELKSPCRIFRNHRGASPRSRRLQN